MMAASPNPLIISSDRLDNGIVVYFDDGKKAFFSAALLYSVLPQTQAMPSESEDPGG